MAHGSSLTNENEEHTSRVPEALLHNQEQEPQTIAAPGSSPKITAGILGMVGRFSGAMATTLIVAAAVANAQRANAQPSAPYTPVFPKEKEPVIAKAPEAKKPVVKLTSMKEAEVLAAIADLDAPAFRDRDAAQQKLADGIRAVLAEQTPGPAGFMNAMYQALGTTGSEERRQRLEGLVSILEQERFENGSKFPPIKGKLADVLPHIEKHTKSKFTLPKDFTLPNTEVDFPLGKNSFWDAYDVLEKLGLSIAVTDKDQLVLTAKKHEGHKMFARKGAMALLVHNNQEDYRLRTFSAIPEPGIGETLGITGASSTRKVEAGVRALPPQAYEYASPMLCNFRGAYGYEHPCTSNPLYRGFRESDVMLKAPENHTRLSITTLIAQSPSTMTLPVSAENKNGQLGPVHQVGVEMRNDGKTLRVSLIPFHQVPWPPTPGTLDQCLWRMGERSTIEFLDAEGKVVPVTLPTPFKEQRRLAYHVPADPKIVSVRFSGHGSSKQVNTEFVLPNTQVDLQEPPVDPKPVPKPAFLRANIGD